MEGKKVTRRYMDLVQWRYFILARIYPPFEKKGKKRKKKGGTAQNPPFQKKKEISVIFEFEEKSWIKTSFESLHSTPVLSTYW